MGYRIGICDDERSQAQGLRDMTEAWARERGLSCRTELFPSAEAFLFACTEDSAFDILLLDVEMPGMTGIDLAKTLRRENSRVQILFVTSHFELAGEGYEVDALHYLIKPVAREKLFSVLDKAAQKLAEEPPHVLISCQEERVKLYESDILYTEAFLHEIAIHTGAKEYRCKENISAFSQRLSPDFFRIHRSYLVNLKKVIRIGRASVTVEGGQELPLTRGKYDDVNRAFIQRN